MQPNYQHAGYLGDVIRKDRVQPLVKNLVELVSDVDFEAFAFCGMSGALIAPLLSYKMKKELLLVRKPSDTTHSIYLVEGNLSVSKVIIVDDCVDSGKTVTRIVARIRSYTQMTDPAGLLLYSHYGRVQFLQPGDDYEYNRIMSIANKGER